MRTVRQRPHVPTELMHKDMSVSTWLLCKNNCFCLKPRLTCAGHLPRMSQRSLLIVAWGLEYEYDMDGFLIARISNQSQVFPQNSFQSEDGRGSGNDLPGRVCMPGYLKRILACIFGNAIRLT